MDPRECPLRINPRHFSLGVSPWEVERCTDRFVDHRKELFLWALAFECGTGIVPLGMENHPGLEWSLEVA